MWLVFLIAFIVLLYMYTTRNYNYWSKRNVKHDKPWPLFGNDLPVMCGLMSEIEMYVKMYNKYSEEKIVGYYRGPSPLLIIRDPEIIKHILNVDFMHFHARGFGGNPDSEPMMLNMVFTDGDWWRLLRQKIPAAFTGSKIRGMFPLILECANKMTNIVEHKASSGSVVDTCNLMRRYVIEVIGSCGFGINMNTINDEQSEYLGLGETIFTKSKWQMVRIALRQCFPESELVQNLHIFEKEVFKVIMEVTKKIRERRNFKPSGRNDFLDILLEMELMGEIKGESIDLKNPDGSPLEVGLEVNLMLIVAQVFVFFGAGFETSSISSSFTLHMLALNPDVQSRVQKEIDTVLSKYNNDLCYEAVCEMSLLEMCFHEAQRIFPPAGEISRVCTKQYKIPDTDITIDPGVKIIIPIQAIQLDPNHFDNPTEFRPERFTPEALNSRHKYIHLPFGEGPRKCIGSRLGIMQSLTGLASLLHRFRVEPSNSHQQLQLKRRSFLVQGFEGGLPVRFKHRRDT